MTAALAGATLQRTKADLMDACVAHGVPADLIHDIGEVFADPQVIHRQMQLDLGGIPGVRSPFRFSGADLALDRPSPKLGEHAAEIVAELQRR